jgi:heme exporter protein D
MASVNHIGFILASYAAAVIVIGAMIAWVTLDYRAQRRNLAELDRRGAARRSASGRAEPAMQEAKEKA